jgi:hypothetical protein
MKIPTLYESFYYQQARDERFNDRDFENDLCTYSELIYSLDDFDFVRERILFLRQNLARAANRGDLSQIIEVDPDYCFEIGEEQDWRCALSGIELEFTRGGTYWLGKWCNPNSCTIDRIDSSKGYVKENIQLITWKANCIKQHMNNDEFIDFCIDVARYNR